MMPKKETLKRRFINEVYEGTTRNICRQGEMIIARLNISGLAGWMPCVK